LTQQRSAHRKHLLRETYVKEQLGHGSIQITVDVDGHLVPGANRAAVDKPDAIPTRNPDATSDENGVTATDAK